MSKKAFFDTCILIAWVFHINSLHSKAENTFDTYSKYYWSNRVINEFNNRYYEKMINLLGFFRDLKLLLENSEKELYSYSDLINFALKNYTGRKKEDSKSSVESFWNKYVGVESQVLFYSIKNSINLCLNDLSMDLSKNKEFLQNIMDVTPPRLNHYSKIDSMLKNQGVKDADRAITLDGHDFACHSNFPVDFVTFDDECYFGAKNVKILCFNSIKGKDDFNAF